MRFRHGVLLYYCSEVLENGCQTDGQGDLVEAKPDHGCDKDPFNTFESHYFLAFQVCNRITVIGQARICIDLRQYNDNDCAEAFSDECYGYIQETIMEQTGSMDLCLAVRLLQMNNGRQRTQSLCELHTRFLNIPED